MSKLNPNAKHTRKGCLSHRRLVLLVALILLGIVAALLLNTKITELVAQWLAEIWMDRKLRG